MVGEYKINPFIYIYLFQNNEEKSFKENIVEKGEIAQTEQFNLFHHVFHAIATFQLSAASLNLGWSQNGILGNGLNKIKEHLQTTN